MKYENFEQAKSVVDQINKHKENLEKLNGPSVTIFINNRYDKIFTIGAEENDEHTYSKAATMFVNGIKDDLKFRIDNLISILEGL